MFATSQDQIKNGVYYKKIYNNFFGKLTKKNIHKISKKKLIEAVIADNKGIGYITSGGFAHFVNKSVAFSYIDQNQLNSENGIQVEINGDLFNCLIIKKPLYDPSGEKMRS